MDNPPNIYVIGASGYVGSAIASRLAVAGEDVVGTYSSTWSHTAHLQYDFWSDELTQLDEDDVVVFAATIEDDDRPIDEFEQRADALTEACSQNRFIYLSSDAVFDGKSAKYAEEAPTNPMGEYGRRTARFETIIRQKCPDYCIIRPSYVYGYSNGELNHRLVQTFRSLRSEERVAYYEDYFKSPIEVNQLAEIVRRVFASDFHGTVHAGGPRVSVYQFHRCAAATFGAPTDQIEADTRPPESPLPVDTSLNSSLLKEEFGLQPGAIDESLTCSSIEDVLCV